MWRRGFGEGARRPRAERGGGGTKRRTQGGKCLGLESSWPHCTRSSTNLEYRLTGRPPDHEDCQHPGIRTTWPSKGRSPSYPERLVLVVVVVVLVALFLPGRQTDRDGPSNGPPPSPFAFRTGTRKRSVFVILVILVQKPFPYLETKRFRRRAHSFEIEPRRERGKGHHLVANGRINVSSYRGPGRGIGSTDAQVSERSASRF